MKFLEKYKIVIIISIVIIILIGLASVAVYRMFYPNAGLDKYGSRMDGQIAILDSELDEIKKLVEDTGFTSLVEYRVAGPIVKFNITLNEDVATTDAQGLATIVSSNLSESANEFYDIEIFYIGSETNVDYPMIAYKSKLANTFDFAINKESEEIE